MKALEGPKGHSRHGTEILKGQNKHQWSLSWLLRVSLKFIKIINLLSKDLTLFYIALTTGVEIQTDTDI